MKMRFSLSSVWTPAAPSIHERARLHVAEQLRDQAEEQQRHAADIARRVNAVTALADLLRAVHPE